MRESETLKTCTHLRLFPFWWLWFVGTTLVSLNPKVPARPGPVSNFETHACMRRGAVAVETPTNAINSAAMARHMVHVEFATAESVRINRAQYTKSSAACRAAASAGGRRPTVAAACNCNFITLHTVVPALQHALQICNCQCFLKLVSLDPCRLNTCRLVVVIRFLGTQVPWENAL